MLIGMLAIVLLAASAKASADNPRIPVTTVLTIPAIAGIIVATEISTLRKR